MRKVRTTMTPDTEIEVSDQEYLDLSRQGLIHSADGDAAPAETAANRTTKPKGDDK